MTSSEIPIQKLRDPQLDIVPRVYYAKMGGSNITHNEYSAISSTNSQVVFSTTTPSVNVGLSRRMYWQMNVVVSFPSTGASAVPVENLPTVADLLRSNSSGLRAYPCAYATDTLSLKLNNATITVNTADIIHATQRYGTNPDERNKFMSGSPSFPDEIPSFSAVGGLDAGARNPFSQYTTNVEEISRQPFHWLSDVTIETAPVTVPPTPQERVRSCVITLLEPLFVPPLNWTERDVQALFGIQTIDITVQLASNLKNRIFSGIFTDAAAGQNGLNSAVVSVGANGLKPILHVLYITPQSNEDIPRVLHYPYYEIGKYSTNGASLSANKYAVSGVRLDACKSSTNVNNISLHSVPKRVYIYGAVRKSAYDSAVGGKIPNIFARITKMSVNWNNQAGMLSSASEYDLYRMSVKNGCDQSWTEWTTYTGGVLCLEPSTDLGLGLVEAPGSRGNYQLQYKIDYENLIYDDIAIPDEAVNKYPYDIFTVVINEGFMTINDATVSLDIGVLTEQAINDAEYAPHGTFNEISNLWGGGFFGDLWRGIKTAAKIGVKIAPDVISGVSKIVEATKGGSRGGARMTKRSLSQRL